jgi:hypothetical protein
MARSLRSTIVAAIATAGLAASLGASEAASAALFHSGGPHGGFHGGGFHGLRGGGFHAFHGGFRSFGGLRGFRGGGFRGGFAHGFRRGGFHGLIAGRDWSGHSSFGRFQHGWGRRSLADVFRHGVPGFASGLGRNWTRSGGRYNAVWGGYGGYGGGGDYYSDFDGLWGGDVFGLEGLAAGLALGGGDCLIFSPVYDNLGQYLGVAPIDVCQL